MISTLEKRIISIGDWPNWTEKWIDIHSSLYDSYSLMELTNKKKCKEIKNRIFDRIIDTSEFVIRCSWMRTRSPIGLYGVKTDAVQTTQRVTIPNPSEIEKLISNFSIENYEPSFRLDYYASTLHPFFFPGPSYIDINKFNSKHDYENKYDPVIRGESERQCIINNAFRPSWNETWFSIDHLFRKLNRVSKLKLEIISERVEKVKDVYESFNGHRVRSLSTDKYLELVEIRRKFHLTFQEMLDAFKGKNWWNDLLATNRYSQKDFEEIIESQHEDFMITRGLQSIYSMINDNRFLGYDKYIIGNFGLDQLFKHGKYHYDKIAEYRLLTNWIKTGKVKYLPESLDHLNQELKNNVRFNRMPIFQNGVI